jgi:hypothetical protein
MLATLAMGGVVVVLHWPRGRAWLRSAVLVPQMIQRLAHSP